MLIVLILQALEAEKSEPATDLATTATAGDVHNYSDAVNDGEVAGASPVRKGA